MDEKDTGTKDFVTIDEDVQSKAQTSASESDDIDPLVMSAAVFARGMQFKEEGDTNKALAYIDASIRILEEKIDPLGEDSYQKIMATMLFGKAKIMLELKKYWEVYRIMNFLCKTDPKNEEYQSSKKIIFYVVVKRLTNLIYWIAIIVLGLIICENNITRTSFIPHYVWDITFAILIPTMFADFLIGRKFLSGSAKLYSYISGVLSVVLAAKMCERYNYIPHNAWRTIVVICIGIVFFLYVIGKIRKK